MTGPLSLVSPDELLDLAVRTARSVAPTIRAGAARGASVAATKSSATDVVTETDRRVEQMVRTALLGARPRDAVQGEEGEDHPGTSGVRWVVDPIDGTVNFLYGLPQYAVSIAAEREGEVVAGVVLNAANGTEYTATLDGPALRDGAPIAVRPTVPLAQRLLATGFSYEAHQREQQAGALLRLLPRIRDIRRVGSCSLDLCMVAEGAVDAYAEEGVNPWDHAAGGLVARRAGARVELLRGAGGRPIIVAAPAAGFDDLVTAMAEAGYFA